MVELVERKKVIDTSLCPDIACPECSFCRESRCLLIDGVMELPVFTIIYCKDCKYNSTPLPAGNASCTLFYGMSDQYGYCHEAEKREEES